jgi:hypothetical protein
MVKRFSVARLIIWPRTVIRFPVLPVIFSGNSSRKISFPAAQRSSVARACPVRGCSTPPSQVLTTAICGFVLLHYTRLQHWTKRS